MENTKTKYRVRKIFAVATILLTAALAFGLLTGCGEYERRHFEEQVYKLSIGDTQEKVTDIMGTPDIVSESGMEWTYYDGNYASDVRERQKYVDSINEYMEGKHYIKAIRQYFRLKKYDKKNKDNVYYRAAITFSPTYSASGRPVSYQVTRIIYNNADGIPTSDSYITLSDDVYYYRDLRAGQNDAQYIPIYSGTAVGTVYFQYGGFVRLIIDKYSIEPAHNGKVTVRWSYNGHTFRTTTAGKQVGSINTDGYWRSAEAVASLDLPEGVLALDGESFHSSVLKEVTLPTTLTKIEGDVISHCPQLSVTVQDAGTYLGNWLIKIDENATSYSVREGTVGIATGVLDKATALESLQLPDSLRYIDASDAMSDVVTRTKEQNVYYVGKIAVGCDPAAESIALRDGTVVVAAGAFKGNTTLTRVYIPDSVTILGESVFENCTSLESVTLSSKITAIPARLFNNCSALRYVNGLPHKLTRIEAHAFGNCKNLYMQKPVADYLSPAAYESAKTDDITSEKTDETESDTTEE